MQEWKLRLGGFKIPLSLLVAASLAAPVLLFYVWLLPEAVRVVRSYRDFGDSWNPMRLACAWFDSPHQGTIYQHVFFEQHIKFQYPPSSLFPFWLAHRLHRYLTNRMLNRAGVLALCSEAAVIGYFAYRGASMAGGGKASHRTNRSNKFLPQCAAALAVLLTLGFGPALAALALGQVQVWLNAWFVLACLCWFKDRRFLAGMFIGAVCVFKPQFALFVLWAALRREGGFLLGWVAVVMPISAAALSVFGLANHLDYLSALRYMSAHGEAFSPNQSINGLLNRYLGNGSSQVFDPHGFPPLNLTVYLATMISGLGFSAAALIYRVRSKASVVDFTIAGLTFTIASPIAWVHHYGVFPIAIVLLAICVAGAAPSARRVMLSALLVLLWVLVANYKITPEKPYSILHALEQSSMFFGGLGVLAMLYALRDSYSNLVEPRLRTSYSAAPATGLGEVV